MSRTMLKNRLQFLSNTLEAKVMLAAGAADAPEATTAPTNTAANQPPSPATNASNAGSVEATAAPTSSSLDTATANQAEAVVAQAASGNRQTAATTTANAAPEKSGVDYNKQVPQNTGYVYTGSVDINPNFIANGEAINNGIDGSGVNVGIVSDSFDAPDGVGSYQQDIQSGDLPDDVTILNDDTTSLSVASGGDEGRAMAQIVHDIAPGADLTFHSAFNNGGAIGASSAAAIDGLVASGADVIADDTTDVTSPVYQRGPQAQATDRAAEAGVTVFTSAGNQADNAIETTGDYQLNTITDAPIVTYQPGESVRTTLHWDDPYQTISDAGNVPTADFDLGFYEVQQNQAGGFEFVFDANGAFVPVNFGADANGNDQILLSDQDQLNGGADPFEFVSGTNNTGQAVQGAWGTTLFDGDGDNRTTRLTFWNGTVPAQADDSPLSGPALAENGIQVGAVNINDSQVETFSSAGPGRLFFDDQGNRLPGNGEQVDVDIAAPDGVNTTHFGFDVANDNDTNPNFFGTSAAAPVAAGAGAILLDEAGTAVADADRPEFVSDLLTSSAQPVGNPAQTGAGLINVQAARGQLQSQTANDANNAAIANLNLVEADLVRSQVEADRQLVEQQRTA